MQKHECSNIYRSTQERTPSYSCKGANIVAVIRMKFTLSLKKLTSFHSRSKQTILAARETSYSIETHLSHVHNDLGYPLRYMLFFGFAEAVPTGTQKFSVDILFHNEKIRSVRGKRMNNRNGDVGAVRRNNGDASNFVSNLVREKASCFGSRRTKGFMSPNGLELTSGDIKNKSL